jgi:hypothetical protein
MCNWCLYRDGPAIARVEERRLNNLVSASYVQFIQRELTYIQPVKIGVWSMLTWEDVYMGSTSMS